MKRLWWVMIISLLLSGCAHSSSTDASPFAPAEEDRLCVYTCLEEAVCSPLVREFQERTGIWTQVYYFDSAELIERLAEPGECTPCDAVLGCTGGLLEANSGLLAPLTLPEGVSLAEDCPQGERWVSVSLEGIVLVYNPKLLRQNLPGGLLSLTDPAWQGKIALADPEKNDFSRAVLQALSEEGEGTLSALAGNLSEVQPDIEAVLDRVADGTDYLAVVPESRAKSRMDEGRDLSIIYPEEGLYLVPEGAAVSADAPHAENARAFLEFLLSEDAQRHMTGSAHRRSVLSEQPENARFLPVPEQEPLWESIREETP